MTDRETSPEELAAELRILIGQLIRRLREESKPGDITPSQISLLSRLVREGPQTLTILARAEGVRTQSAGATAANLEGMGYLVGSPDPADGRQTILAATPSGEELIRTSRVARETWLVQVMESRLTAAERHQLETAIPLLKKLVEN